VCLLTLLILCFINTIHAELIEVSDDEILHPAQRYRDALRHLHVAQHYRPMKNSFVIGLESYSERPRQLQVGGRKTILEAEGQGSLRHIWQTHGPGASPFRLEFFVDGEEVPSIHGNWDDLLVAAEACDQPWTPLGATLVPEASQNWYLPVPFESSLRVDLIPTNPYGLIFLQLDYRLDDDSMEGVRLIQDELEADNIQLRYEGQMPAPTTSFLGEIVTEQLRFTGSGSIKVDGPGIIRRLGVNNRRSSARLLIRYEQEETWAVDVDIADFFGPFRGTAFNNNQAYLPMPFKESVEVRIESESPGEEWVLEVDIEKVPQFSPDWRYFHAHSAYEIDSGGYLPFLMLYAKGRGHWVGLSLYDSGHDHGGGDFAVVDGNSGLPSMLHGINGEDYFSFAFFGQGENLPYSEAFSNEEGRMRIHLENPYPFKESLELSWAVLKGVSPRSVNYWYQDDPANSVLSQEDISGLEWQVFGPVEASLADDGFSPDTSSADNLFSVLPDVATLDAGTPVEATHLMFHKVFRENFEGWVVQPAIGPHLNLMYVYGHVMDLGGEHHMGAYARCIMARTTLHSPVAGNAFMELTYDDPIQVFINNQEVYRDLELRQGFIIKNIPIVLDSGENEVLIRLADTPNNNTSWAGLLVRFIDEAGNELNGK